MQVMLLLFRNAPLRRLPQPSGRARAADRRTQCSGKMAFTSLVGNASLPRTLFRERWEATLEQRCMRYTLIKMNVNVTVLAEPLVLCGIDA